MPSYSLLSFMKLGYLRDLNKKLDYFDSEQFDEMIGENVC